MDDPTVDPLAAAQERLARELERSPDDLELARFLDPGPARAAVRERPQDSCLELALLAFTDAAQAR